MKKKAFSRKQLKPYLWLLPSFIVFTIFIFYPFIKTIYQSFFIVNARGQVSRFVGLENYVYILKDEKFLQAIKNTVLFTLFTVPISKLIGFLLALLANKRRRFSGVYEPAFALPMAMSSSVIAMIFQLLYVYPLGLLNGIFHLNIRWLTDPKWALIAIGIVQIWLSTGYAFVFMLSAVRSVPKELLESADVDGATGIQKMIKIYLPLTTPTLFYLIVTDLAYSMMMMGLVNVLTQGGPNNSTMTVMQYIYRQFAGAGNYTNANPAAIIAFFLTLVCTLLTFIWEKKGYTTNEKEKCIGSDRSGDLPAVRLHHRGTDPVRGLGLIYEAGRYPDQELQYPSADADTGKLCEGIYGDTDSALYAQFLRDRARVQRVASDHRSVLGICLFVHGFSGKALSVYPDALYDDDSG